MKPRLKALLGVVLLAAGHAYAADLLTAAGDAVATGDYSTALAELNKLHSPRADQAEARFLRGTALAGDGKLDAAAAIFRKLIADYPRQPEPYNNLAAIYAREGRLADAKKVLEHGLSTDDRYAALYRNLSDIYVQMARASYAKALRIRSASPPPGLQVLTALKTTPEAPAPIMVASAEPVAAALPAKAADAVPAAKPAPAPAARGSCRRCVQMYGDVVRGIDSMRFEEAIRAVKAERGVALDTELDAGDLRRVVDTARPSLGDILEGGKRTQAGDDELHGSCAFCRRAAPRAGAKGPCLIMAGAGMCNGGRILKHLRTGLPSRTQPC